jgi:hypothetical protein
MAVLRRLLGVTVVTAAAGLAVAGCSVAPLKMGAAAITGNNAISVATLTNATDALTTAGKAYPGAYTLTAQQATQSTLTWLIRFQIGAQLASNTGLNITEAQVQAARNDLTAAAQQGSTTLKEYLVNNGVSPTLSDSLARWEAIEIAYLKQANGGTLPTSETGPASTKLNNATCKAAKSLNIQVNPQFGRMSYTSFTVVDTADSVSRASGTKQTSSISGQFPAC